MYYYFTNICYNNKGLISLTKSKKTGNNFFSPYKKIRLPELCSKCRLTHNRHIQYIFKYTLHYTPNCTSTRLS